MRPQPDLFGHVASDATVSRLVATLAEDADTSLPAIRYARAQARVWQLAPVTELDGWVDLGATLVDAQSENGRRGEHPRPASSQPRAPYPRHHRKITKDRG